MPRVADHDERRATIANAFQELVASSGPGAATFSAIARKAGVSVGSIQHYFADRAAITRFSYEHGTSEMLRRIESRVSSGELNRETIATMTLASLEQMLPLDDTRRSEALVYRSLLAEASHDPALAAVARVVADRLRERVIAAVANGKVCGEVATDLDETTAAIRLLAVTNGLAIELFMTSDDEGMPDSAAVLQPVLDTVFTGTCRRHG